MSYVMILLEFALCKYLLTRIKNVNENNPIDGTITSGFGFTRREPGGGGGQRGVKSTQLLFIAIYVRPELVNMSMRIVTRNHRDMRFLRGRDGIMISNNRPRPTDNNYVFLYVFIFEL